MKIKHLLIGLFAVAATVACKQDETVETPSLEVSQESLELAAKAGEASFDVTANLAWTATADQDWVNLEPASGDASKDAVKVTVTADDNPTNEARTATVTVKAGDLTKTVALTQAAAEAEDPGTNPTVPEVTELYMLGQDCDTGWSLDNMTAFELVEGLWVWEGNLKVDDFRFPLQKQSGEFWPCLVPTTEGKVVYATGDNQVENPYRVESEGYYKVVVNVEEMTVTVERTGDYVKPELVIYILGGAINENAEEGWKLENMQAFESNNGIYTWTGHLRRDEFRFPLQKDWWPCYMIGTDGESLVYGTSDDDKEQYRVETPGVYTITIDATDPENPTVEIELVEADPGVTDITYTVAGTFASDEGYWKEAGAAGLMTLEGDYYVAKNLDFKWRSTCYEDSPNQNWFEFKVVETGTWSGVGASGEHVANTAIDVTYGGGNINVASPEGVYDVYYDKANSKVWVMTTGYKPGDEVPEDEQPEEPQNPDYQVSELYMLGPGSDVGYNLGLITPFKKVDDVWVWEGNLYPNEPFRFQLAKDNQWAPSLTPSNDGKSVYRTEGQNSDYRVESAGFYKVTVNPLTGALDVEKLGDNRAKSLIYELFLIGNAVPAHGGEWKLQKDHPFTNVDGVFTWEGELVPGSIRPVPHVFDWKPTIQKKSDTELELVYDYSSSDITIAEAGKYTLVINAKDSDNITYTLTKHEEPKPEPVLTLAANEATVAADATSYEVALTANCAWEAVATDGVTVTPATGEGDATVTLTFAANEKTTTPVTRTVTFSAGEGLTAVLTLTQAAAEPKSITVADFLAAEVDENVYYRLQGTITSVANTTYGNFDLTDATGTVYIYGLVSEDGATNKYWATSGAKLGDDITVLVPRADFNGTAQGKNARFIELASPGTFAFYTLDTPAVDFASAGGSQDVTVSVYNTDAAVTATSDNEQFEVSVDGYTVTISSAANEVEEKVSGNVTVKVGDLATKTVKVTLAAKPAEGVIEGGQDDFHTISSTNTSYVSSKTTAGWEYKNCAILKGGTQDSSPEFKMIGDANNRALCMNGKTSAVGTITSPVFTTGCGTLKFNYGLPFSDNKIKFRVDIKQGAEVVKTFTVENTSASKNTKYTREEVINVAGDFQIVFTNLSPSNNTGNKDRTALWDVEWTGYQE